MSIKGLALKIMVIALKIAYVPYKLLPTKKKVVLISKQSNHPTLDMALLYDAIINGYSDVDVVVLTKMIEDTIISRISYVIHMLYQLYHIATAQIVVLDGYCIAASVLKHKDDTKIIQMWHALSAVKQFGYQTLNKEAGSQKEVAEIMCMHKNYDYVISAGGMTDTFFSEAFNVNKEKILHLPLPRVDYILEEDEEIVSRIKWHYRLDENKNIVLYVPTFRKNENLEISKLLDHFDFERNVLVVKLHPLDEARLGELLNTYEYNNGLIFDKQYSSYQWMKVCDKVITDYSALAVEASLIGKPLYLYIYDYEEYAKKVGLNIDIKNDMGIYAESDPKELVKIMDREYCFDVLKDFRNKYIGVSTENSTKRIAEFLVDLLK